MLEKGYLMLIDTRLASHLFLKLPQIFSGRACFQSQAKPLAAFQHPLSPVFDKV